jgi:hypothetical protein
MMQMNDQKLIDITFEIALVAANYLHGKSNEEIAEWVAKQLRDCGFDTEPRGASWGILK